MRPLSTTPVATFTSPAPAPPVARTSPAPATSGVPSHGPSTSVGRVGSLAPSASIVLSAPFAAIAAREPRG
ncbi:hypothetical protein ACICHK_11285 [Streptomyces sp. AHU1]|uniref:hypothetical protein n=1 Tax=Streptomyces sp. AHU1 TaxID=3377215 RepID=UPI003877B2B9